MGATCYRGESEEKGEGGVKIERISIFIEAGYKLMVVSCPQGSEKNYRATIEGDSGLGHAAEGRTPEIAMRRLDLYLTDEIP